MLFHQLRAIGKQFSVYGVGTLLGRAVGFLMIPVYTRYLTPSDYGLLELLELTTYVVSIFIFLGVQQALFKHYYKYEDETEKKQVISTATLFVLFVSAAALLLLQSNKQLLSKIVFGAPGYAQYYRVVLWSFFFATLVEVPLAYIRVKQKPVTFLVITVGQLIAGLSLNILFIVGLHWGVWGMIYSKLVVSSVPGVGLTLFVLKDCGVRWSWAKLKEMVRFGGPLIPSSIGMFVLVFSDRFFLNRFASLDEVGIYALAYKFGMGMSLLVNVPFSLVWDPRVFEIAKLPNAKEIFVRVASVFTAAMLVIGLALVALSVSAIPFLAPPAYWPAAVLVPLIVGAYVLAGFKMFTAIGMLLSGQTKYIGSSTLMAALFNTVLNAALIPRWHALGAAVATVLAYGFMVIAQLRYSQRLYRLEYPLRKISELVLLWGAMAGAMAFLPAGSILLSFIYASALLVSFVLLCWFSGLFTREERVLAWQRVQAGPFPWRARQRVEVAE